MSKSTANKTVRAPRAPKVLAIVENAILIDNSTIIEELPTDEIVANIPLYAKSTKVYAPGVLPKEKSQTEILFEECKQISLKGLFTGDKRVDKKIFMGVTKLSYCNTSLSAGFYIWVRSGRPM